MTTEEGPVTVTDAVLRIGEVALRTNVTVATLRAWERRYGLLEPERTSGGHRLYSERDVERVRAMAQLLADGWSASAAARHVLSNTSTTRISITPDDVAQPATTTLIAQLQQAFMTFDARAVDNTLDDVFARFDVVRALDDVILPAVRVVGDGWESDPQVIAREHFATQVVRPRLQRLLRATSHGGGRVCLAAAPEHEEHDIGLLAGAVTAAEAGWNVHYLGARTPVSALERSVATLQPHVVLIGAVFREHAEAFLDEYSPADTTALVLGGDGFDPADALRFERTSVHDGPMRDLPATLQQAVETLQREAS